MSKSWSKDYNYTNCRAIQHRWEVESTDQKRGIKVLILSCNQCNTTRKELRRISDGSLIWRGYHYVEGYQKPAGATTVKPVEFMAMALKEMPDKFQPSLAAELLDRFDGRG